MKREWTSYGNEVIDPYLLQGLAILAKANGRSVVEELNSAVSVYLEQELPPKLGEDGLTLLMAEMRERNDQWASS